MQMGIRNRGLLGLRRMAWRFRRVRVHALVGAAGTGKSFRARLLSEKLQIDLILDDGLLVRGQRILAGRSAKMEANRPAATKSSIFHDEDRAREIREALGKERFRTLLVLGTSEKMVRLIVDRLRLPLPAEILFIEDITTPDEIGRAKSHRLMGRHVIPVPMIEIRRHPAFKVIESIRVFLKRPRNMVSRNGAIEQTIVYPPFNSKGRLVIKDAAVSQMLLHCVQEFNREMRVRKIILDAQSNEIVAEVELDIPFGTDVQDSLDKLQEYVLKSMERSGGVRIRKLALVVHRFHPVTGKVRA